MKKTRKERRTESRRFMAPLSGRVIGVLVRELHLRSTVLRSKQAQRYFRGQRVSDRKKREIITAVGQALVDSGIVPSSPFLEENKMPLPGAVGEAIAWYADRWDELVGLLRSSSAPVDRPDLASLAYLRLAVIDLALRTTASLWLAEMPTPAEGTPSWTESSKRGEFLKSLLDRCGAQRPTREKFSEVLNVSVNTVDDWLDSGVRPHIDHLDKVAYELSLRIDGGDETSLRGQLRRHYAYTAICDLLTEHLGREAVVELAEALTKYTSRNMEGLKTHSKLEPDDAAKRQFVILLFGVKFVGSEHLLKALWRQEDDPLWRTELMAASKPWRLRLTYVMQCLGGLEQAARKANEEYGIPLDFFESNIDEILRAVQSDPTRLHLTDPSKLHELNFVRVKGDAKFSAGNRMLQYGQARSEGDFQTAITHVRRAVELQPENAFYRFHLGAALGIVGEVDEGIGECFIAVELEPEWELPKVEVGIILLNDGRYEDARVHLEKVAKGESELSPHLGFNLGTARSRCGAFEKALLTFEEVLRLQPEHALAANEAAHCAFTTGDQKKGLRLAKLANSLGASETYRKWEEGRYRKRKRN